MEWIKIISISIISSATAVAILKLIISETFKKALDAGLEKFKAQLQIDVTRHEIALKSQIDFKERQLSDFYGPIYALLKRGRTIIYPHLMSGKLLEIEPQIKELAIKANHEISNTILGKSHLIEGSEIPYSYIHFLTHASLWQAFIEANKKGVTLSENDLPEAYYPIDFEKNIFQTTEKLKAELFELYKTYGLAK